MSGVSPARRAHRNAGPVPSGWSGAAGQLNPPLPLRARPGDLERLSRLDALIDGLATEGKRSVHKHVALHEFDDWMALQQFVGHPAYQV